MLAIRFTGSMLVAILLQYVCSFQFSPSPRKDTVFRAVLKFALLGHSSLIDNPGSPLAESAEPARNSSCSLATPTSTEQRKFTWNERVSQLREYMGDHGHLSVPKRYTGHGNLGLWVAKQRMHYRKHLRGEGSPLTPAHIQILDNLGFCWDTSNITRQKLTQDEQAEPESDWWTCYHRLRTQLEASGETRVGLLILSSDMVRWLNRQKRELDPASIHSKGDTAMQHLRALEQLDPAWAMSRRDLQWETRFQQLVEYQRTHGDFNVPISYEDKQLAHWVSNLRKQYNLLQRKQPSLLTEQRRRRLEAIGFVWNRWDDAFAQRQVYRKFE